MGPERSWYSYPQINHWREGNVIEAQGGDLDSCPHNTKNSLPAAQENRQKKIIDNTTHTLQSLVTIY